MCDVGQRSWWETYKVGIQYIEKACVVGDAGICEDETLVGVMSDHEVERMVELPSLQELARQSGGEETVNDGTVSELTVRRLYVYLCSIRSDESFGG